MNALPCAAPALQATQAPTPSSEIVVARWTLEDREVRLLRQQDKLAFSVHAEGVEIKRGDVPLNLHDIDSALDLVALFHKTIEQNLNRVAVTPSAFLPLICTDALEKKWRMETTWEWKEEAPIPGGLLPFGCSHREKTVRKYLGAEAPAPHLKVALFGQVHPVTGSVFYGRFGVYNTSNNTLQSIPMSDEDETTRQFLVGAPRYNRPHPDEPHRHYEMTRYAKCFRPMVIYDADNEKIQSVAMQRVSQIDRNKVIDDHSWAVTLVSADAITGLCGLGFETGHAMIACEGVRKSTDGSRRQFLTYAHITQRGIPDPDLHVNQARVELLEEESPRSSGYMYGPTWVESSGFVERMLQGIRADAIAKRYVTFGVLANQYVDPRSFGLGDFDVYRLSPLFQMGCMLQGLMERGVSFDRPPKVNCLLWCIQKLNSAGISLDPGLFKTPKEFVESLYPSYPRNEVARMFHAREEEKNSWKGRVEIAAENFRRRYLPTTPQMREREEMARGWHGHYTATGKERFKV